MGNTAAGTEFPAVAESESVADGFRRLERAVERLSAAARLQAEENDRLRMERNELRDRCDALIQRQEEAQERLDATILRLRGILSPELPQEES